MNEKVNVYIKNMKLFQELALMVRYAHLEKVVMKSYKENDGNFYWENPMVTFTDGTSSEFDLNINHFTEEMALPHELVTKEMINLLSRLYDFVRVFPAGGKNSKIVLTKRDVEVEIDGVQQGQASNGLLLINKILF